MRVDRTARYLIAYCAFWSVMVSRAVSASPSAPQDAGDEAQETSAQVVKYDHLKTDGDRSYVLKLSAGEPFQIQITNTCPDVFSYEVHGILREEQQDQTPSVKEGKLKALETKTLSVVHDEKYGGYIVTIKRTAETKLCEESEKLVSRTLMISTPKMTWDLSFSGGFTVTNLTNPHFYLRPHPTEEGKKQVQEDPDNALARERAARRGHGDATVTATRRSGRPSLAMSSPTTTVQCRSVMTPSVSPVVRPCCAVPPVSRKSGPPFDSS